MPKATLILSEAHARFVLAAYVAQDTPLDQLPYSGQFEIIYRQVTEQTSLAMTRNCLWRWLSNARKAKKLPAIRKPKKAAGGNPPVDDDGA